MKNEQKISLKITGLIFLQIISIGLLYCVLNFDLSSFANFFTCLGELQKTAINSSNGLEKLFTNSGITFIHNSFYLSIFLLLVFIFGGIYFISYFLVKKGFKQIDEYNSKLKDYNHYLAHEIKTPLSVIHSNLDVLKYEYSEEIVKKSQEELKNITKIIDGLLHFSESLQIGNKSNINLENFIRSYLNNIKDSDKNITIENKEFNLTIYTDEVLFLRIIKNLIENALKYAIDNKLKITLKKEKIIFENKIQKTLTTEEIENITNKFYIKNNGSGGQGLGLPMIKEISKVLGYNLIIKSEDNKFVVEIGIK